MNPDVKLEKLKQMLSLLSDGLTRDEFTSAFKEVIKAVKALEDSLIKKIDTKLETADVEINEASYALKELRQEFQRAVKETRDANETTFANVKKRTIEAIDTLFMKMRLNEKFNEMVEKHEQMMRDMPAIVPADTPKQTRDKLETLEGDERLDKSAIKGLKEEIAALKKELEGRISSIPRGGGRVSRNSIYHTLTPDGSTLTFAVPKNTGGIVIGSDFPTVLMEGAGFTVNATRSQITLTVANAPSLNSQLVFIGNGLFNT